MIVTFPASSQVTGAIEEDQVKVNTSLPKKEDKRTCINIFYECSEINCVGVMDRSLLSYYYAFYNTWPGI